MGFCAETFLRSIRAASTYVEGMGNAEVVKMLTDLRRRGWALSVLDAEGYLAGWACWYSGNHLAWIYVRETFRAPNETGVARFLLDKIGIDTSRPITSPFLPNRERSKLRWRVIFRPYLVA